MTLGSFSITPDSDVWRTVTQEKTEQQPRPFASQKARSSQLWALVRNPGGIPGRRADSEAERLKNCKNKAQGKVSLRAMPWVKRPHDFQALKGRKSFSSREADEAAKI